MSTSSEHGSGAIRSGRSNRLASGTIQGEAVSSELRAASPALSTTSNSRKTSKQRRTPLPIPPKSPRRYDSQSSDRSSPVPPIPSPSESLQFANDPYFQSSSTASSHYTANATPASPNEESEPPTPPAKDVVAKVEASQTESSSLRRHSQKHRTSMVPMRNTSNTSVNSSSPRARLSPKLQMQDPYLTASTSPVSTSPRHSPDATARNAYIYPASSPSRSRSKSINSRGSRTRTSQASTAATFEYDSSQSENEQTQLEKDFMAAIERRRSANSSPEMRFPDRSSMPLTARSGETFSINRKQSHIPQEDDVSPTTPTFPRNVQQESRSARRREPLYIDTTDEGVYRGSRYASGDSSSWSIPVTSASPFGPNNDGGKSLIEEFQSRWSLSTADATLSPMPPEEEEEGESDEPASPYNSTSRSERDSSSHSGDWRRAGRIYSNNTADALDGDTETPRGSVSNQGTVATNSIYSSTGMMRESYPHAARPAPSAMSSANASPLARVREVSRGSYTSQSSGNSGAASFGTPMSELPGESSAGDSFFTRQAMLSEHARRSIGSPLSETEFSVDSDSQIATPFSEGFPASISSASLNTDARSIESSSRRQSELSKAEKIAYKRQRTVQELVETERIFAQDMAIARDVWLARARGKELGEIMTLVRITYLKEEESASNTGDEVTSESGNADQPIPTRLEPKLAGILSPVKRLSIAPPMAKSASQTSNKSMKGFSNPFSMASKSSQQARLSVGPTILPQTRRTGSYPGLSSSRPSVVSTASPQLSQSVSHGSALNSPMSSSDIKAIFANLEEIAGFSETFLAVLEASGSNEDQDDDGETYDGYGEAFNSMLPRLEQVFSLYCSRFDAAIARYETMAGALREYDIECKELSQGLTNAWDLPSLLIKPVQRCLKYPLFIQSLIDMTSDGHPDKAALLSARTGILKVAEGINELKRRQEIVGRVVKGRVRSDSHAEIRRGSTTPHKPRSTSGESSTNKLAKSMSSRFKRQTTKPRTDAPPAHDAAFDALLAAFDSRQRAIYTFLTDAKDWAKSIRIMLVSLLQLSLVWKSVYIKLPGEATVDDKSSRTIDYFATVIVKSIIEGPWRDVDQEIRQTLTPKISHLLDLFRNPRAVIAKRAQKLAECHQPPSVKQDKLVKESAAAYHALNAQLLDELPTFLHAVGTFFTAIIGRFVALQIGLQRIIAEKWLDFAQRTCGQLGPLDQSPNSTISAWWQLHKPIVKQLDTLKILAPQLLTETVEKARRAALPPALRSRQSSEAGSSSSAMLELQLPPSSSLSSMISTATSLSRDRKPSIGRRQSEPLRDGPKAGQASNSRPFSDVTTTYTSQPVARKLPSYGVHPSESPNRASTVSASSANSYRSMTFSGKTASFGPSPSTPSLENQPSLWLGASVAAHRSSSSLQSTVIRGHPYLDCEAGDIFDVLDDVQHEKHALVRKDGPTGDIGWLPLHVLQKVE